MRKLGFGLALVACAVIGGSACAYVWLANHADDIIEEAAREHARR